MEIRLGPVPEHRTVEDVGLLDAQRMLDEAGVVPDAYGQPPLTVAFSEGDPIYDELFPPETAS